MYIYTTRPIYIHMYVYIYAYSLHTLHTRPKLLGIFELGVCFASAVYFQNLFDCVWLQARGSKRLKLANGIYIGAYMYCIHIVYIYKKWNCLIAFALLQREEREKEKTPGLRVRYNDETLSHITRMRPARHFSHCAKQIKAIESK